MSRRHAAGFAFIALALSTVLILIWLRDSSGQREHTSQRGRAAQSPATGEPVRQSPNSLAAHPDRRDASLAVVNGIVLNEDGSLASSGVEVVASLRASRAIIATASTDNSGRYILKATGDGAGDAIIGQWVDLVARRGPNATSRTHAFCISGGDPPVWLPLQLQRAGIVSVEVVTDSGAPVPLAKCWLGVWPLAVASWEIHATDGYYADATADALGIAEIPCPPGHVMVWCRAPEGIFSLPATGTLEPGGALELGPIPVPSSYAHVRMQILDSLGAPVANAGVRLTPEHGVQRLLTPSGGDDVVHFCADAAGQISIRVATGERPLLGVVGAPDFLPLAFSCGRAPGSRSYEVRLEPKPRFRVVVRTESGAVLPRDASLRWHGPTRRDLKRPGYRFVALDQSHPAAPSHDLTDDVGWVERRFTVAAPRVDGDSFTFLVNSSGRHAIELEMCPGVRRAGEIEAAWPDVQSLELVVPDGRPVRVLAIGAGDPHSLFAWPATASMPPDDWPATPAEDADASVLGSRLLAEESRESTLWVPSWATHVAVRRIREITRIRELAGHVVGARCYACGGDVRDCGHDEPGSAWDGPPGGRRFLWARPPYTQRLERVEIPAGAAPVIEYRIPPHEPGAARVTARVMVDQHPIEQAGVWVIARTTELGVPPEDRLVRMQTDSQGVARFALPAADWEFALDPALVPSHPVHARVGVDDDVVEVVIPVVFESRTK